MRQLQLSILSRGAAVTSHRGLQTTLGLALSGTFLWLALRAAVPAAILDALAGVDPWWMAAAMLLYALGLAVRVARWRRLLRHLVQLPYAAYARVLVAGYGVNVLVPARLGELFRVEFFKRSHGVARTWVLSSIALERLLDGVAVVAGLAAGLWIVGSDATESLITLCLGGAALIAALLAGLIGLMAIAGAAWTNRWPAVRFHLERMRPALAVMGSPAFAAAGGLTLVVYILDGMLFAAVLAAVGVPVTIPEILVVMGAASLSTLLPSAPAFIGTYQFAFAIALQQFGHDPSLGVAAATLVQVLLFGPLVVATLVILSLTYLSQQRASHGA